MERVTAVHRPDEYPGPVDDSTRQELADFFAYLFPGNAEPELDRSHTGLAIAALNPKLALSLAKLGTVIAAELPWSVRRDLRELAIQSVHLHFRCDYGFRSRISIGEAAGVSKEMQEALGDWERSRLFDQEQRLVIAYAYAVAAGHVPDQLFAQVVERFGEKAAVEMTSVICFWSFWALFLNATRPD